MPCGVAFDSAILSALRVLKRETSQSSSESIGSDSSILDSTDVSCNLPLDSDDELLEVRYDIMTQPEVVNVELPLVEAGPCNPDSDVARLRVQGVAGVFSRILAPPNKRSGSLLPARSD
eukprot:1831312-Rhodomonas_salina.2